MLKKIFAVMIILFSLIAIPVQMPASIGVICYWGCAFDSTLASDDSTVQKILFAMCVDSEC